LALVERMLKADQARKLTLDGGAKPKLRAFNDAVYYLPRIEKLILKTCAKGKKQVN
jgi:hypothetical protein